MKKLISLLFLAALAQPALAGVYKWVDENGRVHYGERPPAAAKQAKEVAIKDAPPPDPYAEERRARMQRYMDSSNEERGKRLEQQAKDKADEDKRKRMCSEAKSNLHMYAEQGRIYRIDENGEHHYLSDEQKEAKRRNAQEQVEKWCK